jgi:hypothetical protein
MDDKLERILTHPLLRDLPDGVMAEIRELLVRRSVRAGAHIFSKGSQPSGWFGDPSKREPGAAPLGKGGLDPHRLRWRRAHRPRSAQAGNSR